MVGAGYKDLDPLAFPYSVDLREGNGRRLAGDRCGGWSTLVSPLPNRAVPDVHIEPAISAGREDVDLLWLTQLFVCNHRGSTRDPGIGRPALISPPPLRSIPEINMEPFILADGKCIDLLCSAIVIGHGSWRECHFSRQCQARYPLICPFPLESVPIVQVQPSRGVHKRVN